jgi:hypothetical protein
MPPRKKIGFSRGLFVYASQMRLAPQEARTSLVTAVTAHRRNLFHFPITSIATGIVFGGMQTSLSQA